MEKGKQIRKHILKTLNLIFFRYRQTEQSCQMLASTPHAVVRAFIEGQDTDTLMRLLNNREEFGLFLDDYTIIFLMNHFTTKNNFRDAAKLGISMMLQEEYDIPLAAELGLYSAYK